ncbi:hypothetical protein KTN05_13940 [Paracoccus sp. Z118]|nr:hypothetical protein [Paracoccus sp. Z118]
MLAGETEKGGFLTTSYATHHRHSCIGARADFGDLLIGASALMVELSGVGTAPAPLHGFDHSAGAIRYFWPVAFFW